MNRRPTPISRPNSTARKPRTSWSRRPSPISAAGNFKLHVTGTGTGRHHLHEGVRAAQLEHRRQLAGALGQQEARARARARQYRLDVVEQQDDGAEEGRAKNLIDTLKKAAKSAGRHQGRDHPVRHHGQYRHQLQGPALVRIDASMQRLEIRQGCNSGNWKNYWEGCVRDRT